MEQILRELDSRGYVIEPVQFTIGRPDRATLALRNPAGLAVVAKSYPLGPGDMAYANMQELWRSTFGERRQPPGLPRPIEYLPDIDVLIMERLSGRPLAELGTLDEQALENSIALLAALHQCDAQPFKRRDSRGIVRSVERKANRVADLAPDFAEAFRAVVQRLKAVRVESAPLAPCHGDFSPRNVLVAPGRWVIIDWDRFQLADPARDIAHFGAWSWVWELRQHKPGTWWVLEHIADLYDSQRPEAMIASRLHFHVAASLLRIVHGLLELWPDDAYLVPQLLAEALRRLRSG